jgi:RND family efflux transporter MFP subunit
VILRLLILSVILGLGGCGEQGDSTAPRIAERVISVTVRNPERRDVDYVLQALGSVESIHHPTISAEASGQIVEVAISEGQSAGAGQLLARIDNTLHQIEAAKAEAELKRATVVLENQREEVTRLKRLAQSQSVSKDQLEDQEAQLAMLQAQRDVVEKQRDQARYLESKTRVVAPQDGLIARRHISLGDYVTQGTPLFDLVSINRLKARLSFPERDAASIAIGKTVTLASPAAPGVIAVGEVTGINPQISVHNRAIEITVEFDNPGGWLPGASVDATVIVETHTAALTLPPTSVVTRGEQDVVFLVENGRAVQHPVSLGWREVDWVEVTGGVSAEDRVVVQGAALISDGTLLEER